MSRALSGARRAQDRDNRRRRGRLVLQQRIHLLHPDTAKVAAELHDGVGVPPRRAHTHKVLYQNKI
jgi:hypothetical protein